MSCPCPQQPQSRRSSTNRPTPSAIWCAIPRPRQAAVIDPVLDFDHRGGKVDIRSVDAILAAAQGSAAHHRRGCWKPTRTPTTCRARPTSRRRPARRSASASTSATCSASSGRCSTRPTCRTDGSEFDHLFTDGETLQDRRSRGRGDPHAGPYAGLRVLQDRRCGVRRRHAVHAGLRHRARRLSRAAMRARSIARSSGSWRFRRETRLFMCHDYKAPGRDDYAWETTVGEERARNVHLRGGVSEATSSRCARRATRHCRAACCCRRSR